MYQRVCFNMIMLTDKLEMLFTLLKVPITWSFFKSVPLHVSSLRGEVIILHVSIDYVHYLIAAMLLPALRLGMAMGNSRPRKQFPSPRHEKSPAPSTPMAHVGHFLTIPVPAWGNNLHGGSWVVAALACLWVVAVAGLGLESRGGERIE